MKQYDVFISYRRAGGADTAKHLRDVLTDKGYRVFFDTDSLRSGDFDVQLLEVIRGCRDFILILSPGALDRCENEKDWLRQELACALENGKNVVPVIASGFSFPETLPQEIDAVRTKQGVAATVEYFDAVVEKLCSYLTESPKKVFFRKKLLPAVIGVLVAVLALAGLWTLVLQPMLFGAFPRTAREKQAVDVSAAYVLDLSNHLDQAYGYYQQALSSAEDYLEGKATAPRSLSELKRELEYYKDKVQNEVQPMLAAPDTATLELLTGMEEIASDELSAAPLLARQLVSSITDQLTVLDEMFYSENYIIRDMAVNVDTLKNLAWEECTYWLVCTNQLFCKVSEKTVYDTLLNGRLTSLTHLWHTNYVWSADEIALKASEENCLEKMNGYLAHMQEYLDMTGTAAQNDDFYTVWSAILSDLSAGDTAAAGNKTKTLAAAAEGNEMMEIMARGMALWIAYGTAYSEHGCVLAVKYTGTLADYPLESCDMILAVNGSEVNTVQASAEAFAGGACTVRLLRPNAAGIPEETELTVTVEDTEHLYVIGIAY